MPREVTITFDDDTQHVYQNVPDNVTPDLIEARAKNQLGKTPKSIDGGRSAPKDPMYIPDQVPQPQPQEQPSMWRRAADKVLGAYEVPLSAATGAAGAFLGNVAGAINSLVSPDRGTPMGTQIAAETAADVARRYTYQPRTEAGQDYLRTIGHAAESSGVAGLGPVAGVESSVLAGPALRQVARQPVTQSVRDILPRPVENVVNTVQRASAESPYAGPRMVEMPGVGAAETAPERLRLERAQSLPVPVPLTKGDVTRTFEQKRFEAETAKNPSAGEPLRQRAADKNEAAFGNFDAWLDETGAQAPDLRATGKIVTAAVANKANAVKKTVKAAYKEAERAGEMQAPVDVGPLLDYATAHQPESINAPVIASLKAKLEQLIKPDSSALSLNDIEEVRKMVGRISQTDATNASFGREIKNLIDSLTEGAGGDAYKRARALRVRFAKEFEDVGVIDKMMRTKPGSTDRAVAYEDTFKHSILSGSLDDVRAVRRTLQTAGPEGEQAWKELQGQTINHLKEAAGRNASLDVRGNPVASYAGFHKAVKELDADGKLDFIFGKKGAQQIRDLRDVVGDAFTSPPGSVNTSNTASEIGRLLEGVANENSHTARAISWMKNYSDNKKLRKKIQDSLNP